ERMQNQLAMSAGGILIVTMLLAFVVALALVFDPRYRDFPFAPLTAAVVPFLVHRLAVALPKGARPAAETAGASVLALSVIYILLKEGCAIGRSRGWCGPLAALSFSLAGVRDVPGKGQTPKPPVKTGLHCRVRPHSPLRRERAQIAQATATTSLARQRSPQS